MREMGGWHNAPPRTFTPARKSAGGLLPFLMGTGASITRRVLRVVMESVDGGAERSPTETPAIRVVSAPGPWAEPPELTAVRDDAQ